MRSCYCVGVFHNSFCPRFVPNPKASEPLQPWEREILEADAKAAGIVDGKGSVTFFLSDGNSFVLKDIAFDEIHPANGKDKVLTAESFDGQTLYHIPNVLYWTVGY